MLEEVIAVLAAGAGCVDGGYREIWPQRKGQDRHGRGGV